MQDVADRIHLPLGFLEFELFAKIEIFIRRRIESWAFQKGALGVDFDQIDGELPCRLPGLLFRLVELPTPETVE